MVKKEEKRTTRRTQVKDLPQQEKELTKDEQKKVKGGRITNIRANASGVGPGGLGLPGQIVDS